MLAIERLLNLLQQFLNDYTARTTATNSESAAAAPSDEMKILDIFNKIFDQIKTVLEDTPLKQEVANHRKQIDKQAQKIQETNCIFYQFNKRLSAFESKTKLLQDSINILDDTKQLREDNRILVRLLQDKNDEIATLKSKLEEVMGTQQVQDNSFDNELLQPLDLPGIYAFGPIPPPPPRRPSGAEFNSAQKRQRLE